MPVVSSDFQERRHFDLGAKIRLSCGELYCQTTEDLEFAMRLTDLSDSKAEKFVDLTKASYDLFLDYEAKIANLIDEGLKAIIFQEMDVQVFVWKYDEAVGYQAHFQDKRRVTISMHKKTIKKFARLQAAVEEEYIKYKARKLSRKKKSGKMIKEEKPGKRKPYSKKPTPKYRLNKQP